MINRFLDICGITRATAKAIYTGSNEKISQFLETFGPWHNSSSVGVGNTSPIIDIQSLLEKRIIARNDSTHCSV